MISVSDPSAVFLEIILSVSETIQKCIMMRNIGRHVAGGQCVQFLSQSESWTKFSQFNQAFDVQAK